jgi:lysozyme family protein
MYCRPQSPTILGDWRENKRFLAYVKNTLTLEGGWSDGESDPGGATMWGLTERFNPEIGELIRNRTLSKDLALFTIYTKYYSIIPSIDDIPGSIGFIVFDSEFHGMYESIIALQKEIGKHTNLSLVADGVWGPISSRVSKTLTTKQVAQVVEGLSHQFQQIGASAAQRVMRYQLRHKLKTLDYTAGFQSRQSKRVSIAGEVANV